MKKILILEMKKLVIDFEIRARCQAFILYIIILSFIGVEKFTFLMKSISVWTVDSMPSYFIKSSNYAHRSIICWISTNLDVQPIISFYGNQTTEKDFIKRYFYTVF